MRSDFENPWRRLPWTLGAALLIWAAMLWMFGEFLSRPEKAPPSQKPIDAKLIEIPAPPSSAQPEPEKAKPLPKPLPKPEPRPVVQPKAVTQQKPSPPAKQETAKVIPPEPAKPSATSSGLPGGDEMGAHAIYSPKPVIPDEYREDAMDVLVVARFHIAVDGSAKVELIIATPIPELNQSVLDTLNTWKFFPALKDGKPIASVQDVRFRLLVK